MTLHKINPGINTSFSTELNNNQSTSLRQSGRNLIRQLQDRTVDLDPTGGEFAEAYSDADGRLNSVDADVNVTTAVFDTDKYKTMPSTGFGYYVLIEATDVTVANFAVNNCLCQKVSDGQWLLYCTTGTDEVKRASVLGTLFRPTSSIDATTARVKSSITGLTALRTSDVTDEGRKFEYAYALYRQNTGSTNTSGVYTGTPTDTSLNTDFEAWGLTYGTSGAVGLRTRTAVVGYTALNGTSVHTDLTTAYATTGGVVIAANDTSDDSYYEDTTSRYVNNPAGIQIAAWFQSSSNITGGADALLSYKSGTISWSNVLGTGITTENVYNYDFVTDGSVPVLSTMPSFEFVNLIVHDIPTGTFTTTINSAFLSILYENYETGASVEYKLTNATEDSGWLSINQVATFTAFTSEPTKLTVKLIPKTTSPTAGYPSIKGVALYE